MTKAIEDLFVYMSGGLDLLIILLFLAFFKRVRTAKGLWLIPVYCASSLIINIIVDNYVDPKYSYIPYTFFTLLEYLLFTAFIYMCVRNRTFHRVILGLSGAFIIFIAINLAVHRHGTIDSLSIGVETILIILYSFWFMYEQMNNTSNLFIYNKYEFWVVTGLLIYLAGSFFIYIFANQLEGGIQKYWFLTNVFYIIKNIFFGVAIFNVARQSRKKPQTSQNLHPYFR